MAEGRRRQARTPRATAGSKLASALKSENAAKRKEALEEAIKRKIELDKRALHMVESLIEEDITEEFFLDCGKLITPSHYKDTVDERFIIQLCGYPLCRNKLKNVPKQKYKISTKTNKVYDITERKCFCSDFCYRASKYFEAQIPKNPVWMRDDESPPNFKLLKEGQSGQSGLEVKLLEKPLNPADIENPDLAASQSESTSSDSDSDGGHIPEQEFVSAVVPGKQASIASLQRQLHNVKITHRKPAQKINTDAKAVEQKVLKATEQLNKCKLDDQQKIKSSGCEKEPTSVPSLDHIPKEPEMKEFSEDICAGSQLTSRGVSKRGAEQLRKLLDKSNQHLKSNFPVHVDHIAAKQAMLGMFMQTLMEWKTDETLQFLYGSHYTAACSPAHPSATTLEKDELDEDDLDIETSITDHSAEVSKKESLNSLNEALPFKESGTAVKPMPSFERLQKETAMLDVRVREFFKGKYILPEEVSLVEEGGNQLNENEDVKRGDPFLPLIDSMSQHNIRKRIVLEKLKKVLPAILVPLDITYGDVCTELNNLVKTFRLTNKNITHRIPEWSLIAVVLLSLLSPVIPLQKNAQQSPSYTQFISTLLEELHLGEEDLQSLICIFKNKTSPERNV